MIFLHTSDLHLGKRLHEASLFSDQRYILDEICRIAEEKHCTAVVVSGDLYDKSAPSAESVTLLDYFVTKLHSMGIPLLANYGNHDSADRVGYASALLDESGVYFSPRFEENGGEIKKVTLRDSLGCVNFYLLPFLRPATVEAAFSTEDNPFHFGDLLADSGQSAYDAAVGYALSQIALDEGSRNVILCHQYVTGASRSESEDVSVGGIDNISASHLNRFDYAALGHLHKAQSIGRDTVRYSGAPLKYSLDEYNDEKSVSVVTLGKKGDVSVEAVPLKPLRDVRRIRGTYEELTLRENYEDTATEDFIHAILTDETYIPDAMAKLRVIYPNLLKLEYDNVATSYTADLDELSAAAMALDEKEAIAPWEIFAELYKVQNNAPLQEEEAREVRRIFEQQSI